MKKIVTTNKIADKYELKLCYLYQGIQLLMIIWPILLCHSIFEFQEYIANNGIVGNLADALTIWYMGGYSIYENGYYTRENEGRDLSFIDAYKHVQMSGNPMHPYNYLYTCLLNRPIGASLYEPHSIIDGLADFYNASFSERQGAWDWVYSGNSIFDGPAVKEDGHAVDYFMSIRSDPKLRDQYVRHCDWF